MSHWIEVTFPEAARSGYRITSPENRRYNCIAWAADDTRRWWWPGPDFGVHWPADVTREVTLEAFTAAFASLGYDPCDSPALEAGFEKVAIFVNASEIPTHAARQLADGMWTSKLGREVDIAHALKAIEGQHYGRVARVLRRPRRR